MDVEDVDSVEAEAREALLERASDRRRAVVVHRRPWWRAHERLVRGARGGRANKLPDLRRKCVVGTRPAGESFPGALLRKAVAVRGRNVEVVHSGCERGVDELHAGAVVDLRKEAAERGEAKGEARKRESGAA